MIRKGIYITESQQTEITKLVKQIGTNEAETIRRIIDAGVKVVKKELEAEK